MGPAVGIRYSALAKAGGLRRAFSFRASSDSAAFCGTLLLLHRKRSTGPPGFGGHLALWELSVNYYWLSIKAVNAWLSVKYLVVAGGLLPLKRLLVDLL